MGTRLWSDVFPDSTLARQSLPQFIQDTSSLTLTVPKRSPSPVPAPKRQPALTLSVWSWLPVTRRPAAAFRAVMGF